MLITRRSLVLASFAAAVLCGCRGGYQYNAQEMQAWCNTPPYNTSCAWSQP